MKCNECNRDFKKLNGLSQHIRLSHGPIKDYYDKWILSGKNRFCDICGNENKFIGLAYGYTNGCCKEHMNILGYENRKKCLLKSHGVENQFQRQDVKTKLRKTWKKKYGSENPNGSKEVRDKIKKTNMERYGFDHNFKDPIVIQKRKETWIKNWGVDNPFKSDIIKSKIVDTNIDKFGATNPMQNSDIFHKSFKTRFSIKRFNDTELLYQGSYELDFLKKFFGKIEIENARPIDYIFNGSAKKYFPDFYIPAKNMIVEIKSSYTIKLDKEFEFKKKATMQSGKNYICILDKNYEEFEKIIG